MRHIITLVLHIVTLSLCAQPKEGFFEIEGKVTDAITKATIAQCHVYVKGTDVGIVTNNEGKFSIKVPVSLIDSVLVVSTMGYESQEFVIGRLRTSKVNISLRSGALIMEEAIVGDAYKLVNQAFKKVPDNYPDRYQVLTSFYREIYWKNGKYIDVAQGILNTLKTPYLGMKSDDKVSVHKSYRMASKKKLDSVIFKLRGGPHTLNSVDIAKFKAPVLDEMVMSLYDFKYGPMQSRDGKQFYTVNFAPKSENLHLLYEGTLFIEKQTLAIGAIRFRYNQKGLKEAESVLFKKKSRNLHVVPKHFTYEVSYQEQNGKWHLYYVRNSIEAQVFGKKGKARGNYEITSELVVTERDISNVQLIADRNWSGPRAIFSEEVSTIPDKGYWEDYSIITPEKDLRKALKKIQKKST
ncbi:MAG: carboxypeptidase-like regulatory domain-containing protein [Cyclobacteriaceae bacterium]|nr:carboxypeptidase-like regulatory domain-containing protein [Cyclobacteriaceae bacterium HetDA_MAG_MS6]